VIGADRLWVTTGCGETGVREEAGWTSLDGMRLFTFRHVPSNATRVALVVCSPVGGEFDDNYRREALLGRRLAAEGVLVARFHYRGTGNSDGEASDLTFDSMLADTLAVASETADATKGPVVYLGTRLASFVAAEAARTTGAPALVLWHPAVSGAAYFREVARTRRTLQLSERAGTAGASTSPSLVETLERDGELDLAGYTIHRALYDSFVTRELAEPGRHGTQVQLLQWGRDRLDPVFAQLADRWTEAGLRVSTVVISDVETWWFNRGPLRIAQEARPATIGAVDSATEFVTGGVLSENGNTS
jgi:hypothetical protein